MRAAALTENTPDAKFINKCRISVFDSICINIGFILILQGQMISHIITIHSF